MTDLFSLERFCTYPHARQTALASVGDEARSRNQRLGDVTDAITSWSPKIPQSVRERTRPTTQLG